MGVAQSRMVWIFMYGMYGFTIDKNPYLYELNPYWYELSIPWLLNIKIKFISLLWRSNHMIYDTFRKERIVFNSKI